MRSLSDAISLPFAALTAASRTAPGPRARPCGTLGSRTRRGRPRRAQGARPRRHGGGPPRRRLMLREREPLLLLLAAQPLPPSLLQVVLWRSSIQGAALPPDESVRTSERRYSSAQADAALVLEKKQNEKMKKKGLAKEEKSQLRRLFPRRERESSRDIERFVSRTPLHPLSLALSREREGSVLLFSREVSEFPEERGKARRGSRVDQLRANAAGRNCFGQGGRSGWIDATRPPRALPSPRPFWPFQRLKSHFEHLLGASRARKATK